MSPATESLMNATPTVVTGMVVVAECPNCGNGPCLVGLELDSVCLVCELEADAEEEED